MSTEHAKLSPSASERWINCPASIRMEVVVAQEDEAAPGGGYDYAGEGTLAHTMGEMKARLAFGQCTQEEFDERRALLQEELEAFPLSEDSIAEMERHTDDYVRLIKERMLQHPHAALLLEQRVYPGLPQCFGTADAIIVSPTHIEVIDLKYGSGVRVYALENSQLMLYGVGALEGYGDLLGDVEVVTVTIFQPRMENTSSYEITADDLRAWRDGLIPIAESALGQDAKFGPSEEACRWCPAKAICRARMEYMTALDFGRPAEVLAPEEVGELLGRLSDIRDWCNALEGYALDSIYSKGKPIPGWKAVRSGGRRFWTDHAAVIQTLIDHGFPAEKVAAPPRAKGIGEIERLVGKKEMPEILGPYIEKSQGSISLAREGDSRPAVSPASEAASDFKDHPLP